MRFGGQGEHAIAGSSLRRADIRWEDFDQHPSEVKRALWGASLSMNFNEKVHPVHVPVVRDIVERACAEACANVYGPDHPQAQNFKLWDTYDRPVRRKPLRATRRAR